MSSSDEIVGHASVLLVQTTLLILVILVVARVLRRKGPAVTVMIYKAALVGVCALCIGLFLPPIKHRPLISVPPPPRVALFSAPVPPVKPALIASKPTRTAHLERSPVLDLPSIPSQKPIPVELRSSSLSISNAVLDVWATGSALLFAWLIWAQASLFRLRRRSSLVKSGIAYNLLQSLADAQGLPSPELRTHPTVDGPFVLGVIHPSILMNTSAPDEVEATTLEFIFEHELAHIKAKDCAWRLVQRILCAFFWPQLLLWKLGSLLDQASEELCDQAVVASSASRQRYADCLLELANGSWNSLAEKTVGVGVVPFRSAVGRRIAKIMDSSQSFAMRLSTRSRVGVVSTTALLSFGTALLISGSVPAGLLSRFQSFSSSQFTKESDPKALAIWKQMEDTYKGLDTLSMEITAGYGGNKSINRLIYKRPGRAVIRSSQREKFVFDRAVFVEPTRVVTTWQKKPKIYCAALREPIPPVDPMVRRDETAAEHAYNRAGLGPLLTSLLLPDLYTPGQIGPGVLSIGRDGDVDGVAVNTLIKIERFPSETVKRTFSIGKQDHLVHRLDIEIENRYPHAKYVSGYTESYQQIKVNKPIPGSDVTASLPRDAIQVQPVDSPHAADPEVTALRDKITEAYKNLKSLEFEAKADDGRLLVSIKRPLQARISVKMNWDGREHEYVNSVSDGDSNYSWLGEKPKLYLQEASLTRTIGNFNGPTLPRNDFWLLMQSVRWALGDPATDFLWGDLKIGPPAVVNGTPVDTIIETNGVQDEDGMPLVGRSTRHVYAFGREDHLLRQVQTPGSKLVGDKMVPIVRVETVVRLRANQSITADMRFHPGVMQTAHSIAELDHIYDAGPDFGVGDRFPQFEANDLQGKPFQLGDYQGKVLLIHAWTLGVENSETDLPHIEKLYRKYRSQGFEVVEIASDENRRMIEDFLRKKDVKARQLFDGKNEQSGFKRRLNIRRFPYSYLVGRDGRIFATDTWIPDLEPTLRMALGLKDWASASSTEKGAKR